MINRDILSILEFCREKNSIKIFLCHKWEDYEYFKIKQIATALEEKEEIYQAHYCQKDAIENIDEYMEETILKCHLLLFFASNKSLESQDCITELKYAQKMGIAIIPIIKASDGLDRDKLTKFGKKIGLGIDLGRQISFFYNEKNWEDLYNKIYTQIKKIKCKPNFFRNQ